MSCSKWINLLSLVIVWTNHSLVSDYSIACRICTEPNVRHFIWSRLWEVKSGRCLRQLNPFFFSHSCEESLTHCSSQHWMPPLTRLWFGYDLGTEITPQAVLQRLIQTHQEDWSHFQHDLMDSVMEKNSTFTMPPPSSSTDENVRSRLRLHSVSATNEFRPFSQLPDSHEDTRALLEVWKTMVSLRLGLRYFEEINLVLAAQHETIGLCLT